MQLGMTNADASESVMRQLTEGTDHVPEYRDYVKRGAWFILLSPIWLIVLVCRAVSFVVGLPLGALLYRIGRFDEKYKITPQITDTPSRRRQRRDM